jgi:hypothetical protein
MDSACDRAEPADPNTVTTIMIITLAPIVIPLPFHYKSATLQKTFLPTLGG